MKLLLISNSGKPLYGWCKKGIADFVGNNEVTFISAATVYSSTSYYQKANEILRKVGVKLDHLDLGKDPRELVRKTSVFLVAGGNTYQLVSQLKKHNLMNQIKKQVKKGATYIGLSAGANIAGPNILTTNDWNVIGSTYFEGLNLVPFNINPHYGAPQDKILSSAEARDERIQEYLVFNESPVVAIEEQTYLQVEDNQVQVGGEGVAKVFARDKKPKEYKSGEFIKL
jgi:dipeptidase E